MHDICSSCGLRGDGMAGWIEDHRHICPEEVVACPCRMYGCEEKMKRRMVSSHLPFCAAGTILCSFSRLHYTRAGSLRIGRTDSSGGGCEGILRRCDVAQHMRCTHSDTGLVHEKCPFSPPPARPSKADEVRLGWGLPHPGSSLMPWGYPQPASPLHPPPGSRTSAARGTGGAWGGLGGGGHREEGARGEGWTAEGVGGECSHRREAFARVLRRTREGMRGGAGFVEVVRKTDVLVPILCLLPPDVVRLAACTCHAMREACGDPCLFSAVHIASLKWEKREQVEVTGLSQELAQYAPSSRWEATVEWIRVPPPPPVQDWKHKGGECMGQHMLTCPHRGKVDISFLEAPVRPLADIVAAARRLGDAVRAPNGKEEDAVAASLRGGPPRAFLEAEGTEEGEAEGVDGKYGEVCEAGLFRAVMAQDVAALARLVRGGVDINATNSGGYTPLGLASERGKTAAINWLIRNGGKMKKPGEGTLRHLEASIFVGFMA